MNIVLLNQSSRFTDRELRAARDACYHQLRYNAAPAWERTTPQLSVIHAAKEAGPRDHIGLIVDKAEDAQTLGFHDEGPDGNPYFRVFVDPVLDNGGTTLNGSLSVSAVTSHEVLELFGDEHCTGWEDNWYKNEQVARELCDPVETLAYDIGTRYGKVTVSDFVCPPYFDPQAPLNSTFDYMGRLRSPFSLAPGGYLLVRSGGKVTPRFATASQTSPLDKTKNHPASRTWLSKHLTTTGAAA